MNKYIHAIEQNMLSWLPVFERLGGAQQEDIHGAKRTITNIPLALFNSIMSTRLDPEDVEPTIEYIVADAVARNVPVLWWIGPSTRPTDLAKSLINHGFDMDEDGPGMAVELASLNDNLPGPEGLSILPARDEASWHAWCQAMTQGFEVPAARIEFARQQWYDLLSKSDPHTTQAFIAWKLGRPVATSLLQLGGGAGGIYGVATIPEERRKGIGAQVTLHALKRARQMGYTIGILQSSDMGLPVYRSIGFKECCQITSYRWTPDPS